MSFPEAGYYPYYDETNTASTGVGARFHESMLQSFPGNRDLKDSPMVSALVAA